MHACMDVCYDVAQGLRGGQKCSSEGEGGGSCCDDGQVDDSWLSNWEPVFI